MSRIENESGAGSVIPADLKDKASEVTQNLRDLGGQVRDAAKEKYENLSSQARDYYEQGQTTAHEWEESLESYVKEKPLQALMVAAGVGVLLGILWKRS